MDIKYLSTRGGGPVSSSLAILKGIAEDGGLYMPERIPQFDFETDDLIGKSYKDVAYEVMKLFLTDYSKEELMACINSAYDSKFDTNEIAPLHKAGDAYYLELFHGQTIAFKDMALSILPHLMVTAARKNNVSDTITILTATSGDTGKAAMAGFADVPGTRIIVFYPKGGVSRFQELQMLTQTGDNTDVVSIHGNFDDAQTGVKNIFADREFEKKLSEKNIRLSSANSINIGRLIPQIVYYVYAYAGLRKLQAVKRNEKINICVPTGNFGNILAAYFAKIMGLPVNKLICASNDNKVLYDFFESGTYDRNRKFVLTSSPSMDILISSNFERLVYLSCGCDPSQTANLMRQLKETGRYTVTPQMKENMKDFAGCFATEQENASGIRELFEKTGYLIDTHTGVASRAYEKYRADTADETVTVIASTASPYKFCPDVLRAVKGNDKNTDLWDDIKEMNELGGVKIPKAVLELKGAKIRHNRSCEINDMEKEVSEILGIEKK